MAERATAQLSSAQSVSAWNSQEDQKSSSPRQVIRLADFIRDNTGPIALEWENFARTLAPANNNMTSLALRDHIGPILAFIVSDMQSRQTAAEQIEKAHGEKDERSATSAAVHASLRLKDGFNIDQMVSEYRALRASIIKLWRAVNTLNDSADVSDLVRFGEAIDQIPPDSRDRYPIKSKIMRCEPNHTRVKM